MDYMEVAHSTNSALSPGTDQRSRVLVEPGLESKNMSTTSTEGDIFRSVSRAKDAANKSLSPYIVELPCGKGYAWLSSERRLPRGYRVISRWRWVHGEGYQLQIWKDVGSG